MNKGIVFLGMGFEMVSMVLGSLFFGPYIDPYVGGKGNGTVLLILLLMVGWFAHVFVLVRKFEEDIDDNPKP
jgi:hypothetical protein